MPPLPPKPGLVKVICGLVSNGIPVCNTFHVWDAAGGSFSQAEVDAIASGMFAAYGTNFKASIQGGTALTNVTAQDLSSATGPVGLFTGSTAGTNAGTVLPNSIACVISWKTQRRYRGGHGRTYLPGIPNTALSGANFFQGSYTGTLQTAANAFRLAVPLITLPGSRVVVLAIPHYYRGGAQLPSPDVDVVTGQAVNTGIDTQRRRLT